MYCVEHWIVLRMSYCIGGVLLGPWTSPWALRVDRRGILLGFCRVSRLPGHFARVLPCFPASGSILLGFCNVSRLPGPFCWGFDVLPGFWLLTSSP